MAVIRMAAGWRQALAAESHPRRQAAIRHAERTAQRLCPVDTGALASTIEGEASPTSMDSRLSAGNRQVDYAAVVELGGAPHRIVSHGPWPLRNKETGQVFGRAVNHPGTPAQPYLRPGVESMGTFR